jgi:hypothetical protein
VDTVESGIVDQDLRQLSELLDLSSRDPIDGFTLDDTDASIWVKGVAVTYLEIFCMTTVFQNKSGRKLSSHLSELSSHLVLRSAAEAIA